MRVKCKKAGMVRKNAEMRKEERKMKHWALQLYDYHVWANERVFRHLSELPEDVSRREVQSVFPSVFDTLVHLYRVDNTWLLAMTGKFEEITPASRRILEEAREMRLPDLEARFREMAERYRAFWDTIDLEAVTAYPHPQYGTLNARYAEIVQHVVNHGTYHRGNITAMLRQMGFPGVPTDYVFFLYEKEA